jgi:hypothetical protein
LENCAITKATEEARQTQVWNLKLKVIRCHDRERVDGGAGCTSNERLSLISRKR